MTKNHTNKLHRYVFHATLTAFTIVILVILAAYQGIVKSDYTKVSPSDLLSKTFWQALTTHSQHQIFQFASCEKESPMYTDAPQYSLSCNPQTCAFYINGKQINIIREEGATTPKILQDTELLWADATRGRLVYIIPAVSTAYMVEYDPAALVDADEITPTLWHDINLDPSQGDIDLITIKSSKNMGELLVAQNLKREELYLYGLDEKWLYISDLSTPLDRQQPLDNNGCIATQDGQHIQLQNVIGTPS